MYAIIETGGKQYKISEGDTLLIEKLDGVKDDAVKFANVLLLVDGDKVTVGTPYIEKAEVSAKILSQEKGEKIRVAKFKAKVRYRRVTGHRQLFTRVLINKIKIPSTKK